MQAYSPAYVPHRHGFPFCSFLDVTRGRPSNSPVSYLLGEREITGR